MSGLSWNRVRRVLVPLAALVAVGMYLTWPGQVTAATAVRINTGGPAQTVSGVQWSGCASTSACNGYVSGGNAWAESPPAISGIVAPASQTIHSTEWTGGATSGIPVGGTAFTFAIPATDSTSYDVKLHFSELNKFAAGARVFDVKINGTTVLNNFDIFAEAGGAYKAITRTFSTTPANGKVTIQFIREVQNAKVSAIELLPTGTTPSTSSSTTTTSAPPASGSLSWSKVTTSPQRTLEATGTAFDGRMYYFGGYQATVYLPMSTAYSYNPSSNVWTRLPDMPKALTHSTTAIDGRGLIIAGGYGASNGHQVFASSGVYRYNVDTKVWSTLPSLPAARGSGATTVEGRTLHFMGGVDGARVEKVNHWTLNLDNTGEGWKSAPDIPSGRTHFAAVTFGGNIYTLGGLKGIDSKSTQLNQVYKYTVSTKTWTQVSTTPLPISHITNNVFVYNSRIWLIAGEAVKFAGSTDAVHSYDPVANTWRTETKLPAVRHAGVAGQINGALYFITGTLKSADAYKGTFN